VADPIVEGDQAVMLASVTPAGGVVLAPVTNFGTCDRARGTVTVNTSIGAARKLERIRRNPRVALAFHTRAHGTADCPEYVLIQGTAELSEPIPDYDRHLGAPWRRGGAQATNALWRRWMRVYHERVEIVVRAERVVVWPDLACAGRADIHGPPLPAEPPSQPPPKGGTAPRVAVRRAARHARRLPHLLLGWVGSDGLPLAVPVAVGDANATGIPLRAGAGVPLPPGARRAGLTAHAFTPLVLGQDQRVMTGWLQDGVYAPHTLRGYRLPASPTLYRIVVGFETRRRLRR
jgi:hypothetical protein